ncbi:MAG TPA: NUDIX domain-containing protein [Thermomicrobiales bacterium]|nr:NUDIX domain-containing protein [Thermomicrobiales bacterium]
MPLESEPQFGNPVSGVTYHDRPGVYALVLCDNRLLVVETPAGYFLPGGGIDAGELEEDSLRRELIEEVGLSVTGFTAIGTARQYVIDSDTGIGYNKIETFFRVTTAIEQSQSIAHDHAARWIPVSEALAGLREPAQAWAVRHECLSP